MQIDGQAILAFTPWVAGGWFAMLFAAERLVPLRTATKPGAKRWGLNAVAVAVAFGTAAVTVSPTASATLQLVDKQSFGILQLLPFPPLLTLVCGMLMMDLSFYYWHRLNHAAPLLWRFHNVHHIDPDLDSTTSFRFHFGEIAYSAGFRFVQILIIGPPLAAYAVYEAVFICGTVFHHSNIRLPLQVEQILNKIFVTPRMHGVHHSVIRDETNSNYSVVFRWWDKLHRTLRLNTPQRDIRIGVAAYTTADDNSAKQVFVMPFESQREYWKTPEGKASREREPAPGGNEEMMAE
mgnify:CR=1 FL=1